MLFSQFQCFFIEADMGEADDDIGLEFGFLGTVLGILPELRNLSWPIVPRDQSFIVVAINKLEGDLSEPGKGADEIFSEFWIRFDRVR